MKTQIQLILGIIFLLLHLQSPARQLKNATVIDKNGNSLKCRINDQNWSYNPSSFRAIMPDNSVKEFMANDISSIKIDSGDYYVSAYIPVDMNYVQSLSTGKVEIGTVVTDTFFLRVILDAQWSLYLLTDINGKDHFYIKSTEGSYEELIDKNVQILIGDKYLLQPKSTYKVRLHAIMKDCSSCITSLNTIQYTEKKLTKLFLEFNNTVTPVSIHYLTSQSPVKVFLTLFGGVDLTHTSFVGEDPESHLELFKPSSSTNPAFGVRVTLPLARMNNKHSISFELGWRQYGIKSYYSYKKSSYSTLYTDYDVQLDFKYLKFSPAYTFRFSSKKFSPFLSLGGTYCYLLSSVNKKHQDVHYTNLPPSYHRVTDTEAYEHMTKYDAGIFIGAGCIFKRISLEGRYENYVGFSNKAGLDEVLSGFSILAGFRLF
jgi:hypothetical protein